MPDKKNISRKPDHDPHHPDKYVDEPTKDRIEEHLSNPNDEITEQDIRNVDTTLYDKDSRKTVEGDRKVVTEKEEEPEEIVKPDKHIVTPWDTVDPEE